MSLDNIIKDDYGQTIELTFIDVDTNAAADISGYSTTKQMIFTAPDGTETTKTATFKTDGTDGIIEYTVESAFIDDEGGWQVRGKVSGASATLSTVLETFIVQS